MTDAQRAKTLEREVLRRLDPRGQMAQMLDVFGPLVDSRIGRGVLWPFLRLAKIDLEQLRGPITQARKLTADMAEAIALFTPLGWAPSSKMPVEVFKDALAVYQRTGSVEKAEGRLVEGWNSPEDWFHYLLMPIRGLGFGHDELHGMFLRRANLVEKAVGHHKNGAYEASVPIVLAQVEGITHDLSGRPFFSKKAKAPHLTDDSTIAGLPDALQPLRSTADLLDQLVGGVEQALQLCAGQRASLGPSLDVDDVRGAVGLTADLHRVGAEPALTLEVPAIQRVARVGQEGADRQLVGADRG